MANAKAKVKVENPELAKPVEKTAVLVKVIFESNVNGIKMTDELKLRAGNIKEAKEIFMMWTAKGAGIRGDSGIFHPLSGYGDIKIKEVKETHDHAKSGKDGGKAEGSRELSDSPHDEAGA